MLTPTQYLQGILTSIAFVLNTVFWTTPLYILVFLRAVLPIASFRNWSSEAMVTLGENWILSNTRGLALIQNTKYSVHVPDDLRMDRSYLVMANHQSWVDIVVLQTIFTRKIPFLRFFLKNELRYIPLLGGAWKALDFPFMKRHSKTYLEKHPEKRGEDLAETKKACDKLAGKNISIINFLEGTRFTPEKHAKQKSAYQHLLPPKAGGIAFVLQAMGPQFDALLDVTISYPGGAPSLWEMFTGRLMNVVVWVDKIQIPKEVLNGDYFGNEAFRKNTQDWLRDIWLAKDQRLQALESKR
ncbi:MAG: acyltransferase [Proteobacteria bacterium]|nr:MAG: acyltransferase [Pseudomonadota bacterium]